MHQKTISALGEYSLLLLAVIITIIISFCKWINRDPETLNNLPKGSECYKWHKQVIKPGLLSSKPELFLRCYLTSIHLISCYLESRTGGKGSHPQRCNDLWGGLVHYLCSGRMAPNWLVMNTRSQILCVGEFESERHRKRQRQKGCRSPDSLKETSVSRKIGSDRSHVQS